MKKGISFGEYIKYLRGNKTLNEVEKQSGVTCSFISKIENGRRGIPSPQILEKLAPALGVTYEELMKVAGYIKTQDNNELNKQVSKKIGKYIKKLRGDKSYSHLARESGVDNTYISKLEKGQRGMPSPSILKKLAPALGVTYEDLMEKAGYINAYSYSQDNNMENDLGNLISKLRKDKGISQRKLANYADISNTTVNRIEKGEVAPDAITLKKIALSLGTSPNILMEKAGYIEIHTNITCKCKCNGEAIEDSCPQDENIQEELIPCEYYKLSDYSRGQADLFIKQLFDTQS